jgi:hypothetical protein
MGRIHEETQGRTMSFKHVCGNEDCCTSTGIHEGLTFGRGELDFNGYWEIPCYECARAFEDQFPDKAKEWGPCWPFKRDIKMGDSKS